MNDLFGEAQADPPKTLEQIEREAIAAALERYGTATAAAQHLNIGRATIHRKMKRYGLKSAGEAR